MKRSEFIGLCHWKIQKYLNSGTVGPRGPNSALQAFCTHRQACPCGDVARNGLMSVQACPAEKEPSFAGV